MIYDFISMCLYCMYIYTYVGFNLYMTTVHSSTVAAILWQLHATSILTTVGGMYYAILSMIGLTSHCSTNYN